MLLPTHSYLGQGSGLGSEHMIGDEEAAPCQPYDPGYLGIIKTRNAQGEAHHVHVPAFAGADEECRTAWA